MVLVGCASDIFYICTPTTRNHYWYYCEKKKKIAGVIKKRFCLKFLPHMAMRKKLIKVLVGIGIALLLYIVAAVFAELKFASFIGSLNRTGSLLVFYAEKTHRFPESESDLIKTLGLEIKETETGIMYTSSDPNISLNHDWRGIPLFRKFQIRYGTKKTDLVSFDKKLYLRSTGQQFLFVDGPYNNWALFRSQYEGVSRMIYEMMKE
jgi:hypothetical protein